ncbi:MULTISPECIES: penicillin-binding transpeptidase domain-containing protein [unclassified Microbacterium]|uniref:peptidoglycan D,D-transpeptidase FtsI family protein n=1 Tax=unclassified Microbacterium TaxID=2609290 RepID=UPI001D31051B|nr:MULTISPECIES: penicillin-binding transpeptidase domain-containing protein [unclassified Microbacterium]CAH0212445.1 Penicillin-binding protein A [Microbacterium sp. Bi121]HWK77663.1 penicillin-binding transpeptidase domain-containing protein [Microbacterium sp.]
MTKEMRRLSIVMLFMFLSLFVATSWIQVVEADNLGQADGNTRSLLASYEIQRGSILVDDSPIVSSVASDDEYRYQREYVDSPMWSSVTGFFNPALQSSTGIENAFNADLSGTGASAFLAEIERIVSGQPQRGFSIELTLDAAAQRAAYEAFGDKQGAAVAIEPSTGRILAMYSTPGYDANELAVHSATQAEEAYNALDALKPNPLINNATDDVNPPGSTFKVLVAAAAYATGEWTPESTLPNPARYTLPGSNNQVRNAWGGTCGSGSTVTIAEAVKLSCNIPMAELAVELGSETIFDIAEKFGFNQEFTTPLPVAKSSYPRVLNDPQTALTGFGQGQVTATALQVAMISAGLANDGLVMKPRLVDAVIGNDLSTVREYPDEEFGRAVEAGVADDVTAAMVASVTDGAAQGARIDGVEVAGKTGTAEHEPDDPYTLWFTGFAPADNPQIAVAVVVEDGGGMGQSGSGDTLAAPIAKKIIEAVLNK